MVNTGTPAAEPGSSGTYAVPFSLQFQLSSVLNKAEFTGLYDQYRIAGVTVRFIPLSNTAGAGGTALLPTIAMVRDYDDAILPASVAAMAELQGYREMRLGGPKTIKLAPKPTGLVYSGAVLNGYSSPRRAPWLDCGTDGIPHYALKGIFRNVDLRAAPTVNTVIRVEVNMTLQFKGVR